MTLPSVSVMIPTYARTGLLSEAIQSVLSQWYCQNATVDIIVLNDCPKQDLWCSHPQVTVMNVGETYPSLGAKRHEMLKMVHREWVAFLDDDDVWLPWHLEMLRHVDAQTPAVLFKNWFIENCCAWSWGPIPGGIPMMVRSTLAKHFGFNSSLSVGEDNEFRNKIKLLPNIKEYHPPSYVYRTNTPVCHIGRVSGDLNNFRAEAERRFQSGAEPQGVIEIRPEEKENWWKKFSLMFPNDIPRYQGL